MKAGEIFSGTMGFCWLKLVLGLADVLIGAKRFVEQYAPPGKPAFTEYMPEQIGRAHV